MLPQGRGEECAASLSGTGLGAHQPEALDRANKLLCACSPGAGGNRRDARASHSEGLKTRDPDPAVPREIPERKSWVPVAGLRRFRSPPTSRDDWLVTFR